MQSRIKTFYGATIILLLLITLTAAINTPDYQTVKIKELELTLTSNKTEYKTGETAIINVYLTNNHPYKIQVTLPDHLTHNQVFLNHMGPEVVGIALIEDRNQTIIIEPYSAYYLATLTRPQRRVGYYRVQVGLENLHQSIIINVTGSQTDPPTLNTTSPYYYNSTHVFGLESINCTLPTVPAQIPIPRKHTNPITASTAREIAENVFGFQTPYELNGDTNPTITHNHQRLTFPSRYDILYSNDVNIITTWNDPNVTKIAQDLLDKLKPYWVDETSINYSLVSVSTSRIAWKPNEPSIIIHDIDIRYQNTLNDIPLSGPGADFRIEISNDIITNCEIRRPILTIQDYTNITVTPQEAIQKMLRGESATPEIGFDILQMLPLGSPITINDITLNYYTDRTSEWLIPVYLIHSKAHVDPETYDEPTSEFTWYIFATDFRAT